MTESKFKRLVELLHEYSTEVTDGEIPCDNENDPKGYTEVAKSLEDEFCWYDSPEGEDFWAHIFDILDHRSRTHKLCSECGQHLPE